MMVGGILGSEANMTRRSRSSRQKARRRWQKSLLFIPRLLLLLVLGAVTIIAPISGFVRANNPGSVTAHALAFTAGESWAETPQGNALASFDVSDLQEDLSADLKARMAAVPEACRFNAIGSGNKTEDREITDDTIIFPLPKGVFRKASPFGYRIHPISGIQKLHEGVDLSCSSGTLIRAIAKGKVVYAAWMEGGGNTIQIEHHIKGETFYSAYKHQITGSFKVKVGDEVEAGTPIGLVGSTGMSTGPHLHLEIHPDHLGNPVDPWPWLERHGYLFYGDSCD